MKEAVVIRPAEAADETRWRELWDGYLRNLGREPVEELTRHTWARILDPAAPVHAIVAERVSTGVLGFANYVIQESTLALRPCCYLADLFVDPAAREGGIGRALTDWLWAQTQAQQLSKMHWNTRETNHRAQSLYDSYTKHSGLLHYELRNA